MNDKNDILILGGGLTGLSADMSLQRQVVSALGWFESDSGVGGLFKNNNSQRIMFDLGGHRFFTKDRELNDFVKALMKN